MDIDKIRSEYESAGQDQVFRFWDRLDDAQKQKLAAQLAEVDLAEIQRLVDTLVKGSGESKTDFASLEPAPYIPLPSEGGDVSRWGEARKAGEEALRAGRVAAFTVAGGQGTRLGYDGPKGTFPVTPVRNATLFQVFAEKILAASQTYGVSIPWFIMTSRINHEATVQFFNENDFFGLQEEDVVFFSQGMMPAVDFEGKLILESPDSLALSPDGHGGSLRALVRSGATAKMKERGIDIISYFQVDNPLVQAIDPTFVGFHVLEGSEMSSKMIPKAYAGEKVGHFTILEEKLTVIEYSDLPVELAEQQDDEGRLRFRAGSIAIHIISRDFVERMGGGEGGLPMHRADKKIGVADENGETKKPDEPNGVKFEMFVFDALPEAKAPIVIETARDEDFSPVKNAEGLDSPETCRRDLLRQYVRWLKDVGVGVPADEEGVPDRVFEITPLRGFDRESFARNPQNQGLDVPAEDDILQ
ncbi:MAG: UTP--glucose-1-phosphate uridylyltransferase [Puniceicoccales bacterium]